MRKNIVAGNWKMNTSVPEGVQLAKEVCEAVANTQDLKCDVIIGVPFTHLTAVHEVIDINYDFLGLIDPNATVNIIEDGKTVKKVNLEVPETVTNIIHCKNPRCVTSVEHYFDHVFHLVDKEKRSYRCEYCDDIVIPYPNK